MDSPKIKCSTDAEWREYYERQCTSLLQQLAIQTTNLQRNSDLREKAEARVKEVSEALRVKFEEVSALKAIRRFQKEGRK